jgi:UDP-glucose 4-epimerase
MSLAWVTGARGFIGQYLVQYLSHRGHLVAGLGHGTFPSAIAEKDGITHWINGEIDAYNLQQLQQQSGMPSVIYHLAGGSSVGVSLQIPAEDFRRTVLATSVLLEWARKNCLTTPIVMSSSAAVYGNTSYEVIPEEGCFTPYSPYGFHKRAAELLCESYAQTYGLKISIVRLFSVYGPKLQKQLLWDVCNKLLHSPSQIQLNGTGQELRDWIYIEDAIKILVAVSELMNSSSLFVINGGTGKGRSIDFIVRLICRYFKLSPDISYSGQQRLGDPFSLVADTKRLMTIKTDSFYDLAEGVKNYCIWFQDHYKT